jgi:polysaccharide biosynthesis/export protein
MKKFVSTCFLISLVSLVFAQNFGNFAGALTGNGSTAAAAAAAKQLQTMNADNPKATANLSQLQLLGLDPATIQKYVQAQGENKNSEGDSPADMLQMMLEMKAKQDAMQASLDEQQKLEEPNNDIKQNDIYGHNFFSSGKLALFEKSTEAKAPDSYILGVGDEISISVWGYADYNNKFTVTPDGYIQIPEFGRVYVNGMTFGAVKAQIGKRLATFINLNNTNYEITLNYSRTIDVNIVGEVNAPGTYQIPAINSVYNAINAANGITDIGSIRDIQVRRDGKTVKRFDVYEFLFNPLSVGSFFLQKGDFIYVPTQIKVVQVTGSVRREAKYELLRTEQLNELIKFAGGFAPDAYAKSIQIIRTNKDKAQIIDVNYEDILSGNSNFELLDGDIVSVPSIPEGAENFVNITGTVRYPGKYQLKEGFRISDVIKSAGGIKLETYLERAYIRRKLEDNTYINQKFSLSSILQDENSSENLLLQQADQIQLFSKEDFIERFKVSIDGSVMKPTVIDFTDGMTLNDLLFYAGGLKKEAANSKIEISRVMNISSAAESKFVPQHVVVKTIKLGSSLEMDEASKSFMLAPMDKIYVRKIYGFNEQMNVTINGEVMYPGIYPILDKNETVLELIERAGGLTPYAYLQGAKLTRTENQLPNTITELKEAFKDPKSRANMILKDGDLIEIPTVNQLISVKGAIRYPNIDTTQTVNGRFIPGKSARWYVKNYAGGFKKGALKKSTMVIYPNRKVDYTRSFIGIKNYPTVDNEGALITVEMKNKPPKPPKGPEARLNWNIVLPSLIAAVTSIATTLTLIFVLKQ